MRNHVNLEAPNPMKMFPSCLLHGNIAFSAWPSCCSFNGRTYRPISMAKFKYEWHEVEGSGPFQVQSSPAPKTMLGHNEMHSHIRNLLLYCPPQAPSLWGVPPHLPSMVSSAPQVTPTSLSQNATRPPFPVLYLHALAFLLQIEL